jgi:holliday junction DNA helicase RuvA
MIGRLSGIFADAEGDDALIEVGGVGYLVRCGSRTLSRMPPLGEPVVLHIESQTREDGTRLFGFLSKSDRAAFVSLQAIQGVGPKAALAVLDILPPAELAAAVAREDKAAVGRASGVGPKLAQRIVTELKGKPLSGGLSISTDGPGPAAIASPVVRITGEAVAALIGLGIPEPVARRSVEAAEQRLGPDPALSALIKAALQEVGR